MDPFGGRNGGAVDPFGGRNGGLRRSNPQPQATPAERTIERATGAGVGGAVDPFGGRGGGDGHGAIDPFGGRGAGGGGLAEAPPANMQLQQCPHCSRKFNPISLAKHVKNCKKVFQTKRKAFDMKDKRLKDAVALNGGPAQSSSSSSSSASSHRGQRHSGGAGAADRSLPTSKKGGGRSAKWKSQSSALREAMKQSRLVSKYQKEGRLHELPPMQSAAPDPSLVPCPNCGRTFNEKAAARHIPRCKNIKAKPKMLMRGGGTLSGVVGQSGRRRGGRRR